ncbi:MAG: Phthiocerol synthesis polyketide synthase type I PpsC [Candidatus Heimdallarchaeota archaeon LC_3]|nr:MAG: Phthiocerol synthesis polyketide synthase type I PpsC [Candidatus Heimdallarchaeota archaeon LC_3]
MPSGVFLKRSGSSKILKIEEYKSETLKKDEIRVKLHYAGVNYADILARKGIYKWTPKKPYVLGFEGSGEILEIGEEADNRFKIGQNVIIGSQYGCYSTEIITKENQVFPIVPQYSMQENGGFLATWITAFIGLCVIGRQYVGKNKKILINSAAGGVGTSAVQIAKELGTEVVGAVGNDKKFGILEELGVDQVINYQKQPLAKYLPRDSIDFCLESVGGKVFSDSVKVLKPLGMLLTIGISSIDFSIWRPLSWLKTYRTLPRVNVLKMISENKIIGGFHIGRLMDSGYKVPWNELVDFVTKHNLRPKIGKIFQLKDAGIAHDFIESRESIGKILLKCIE